MPADHDAGLYFIGIIRTPWATRSECPKNGRLSDAVCTIEVAELYEAALTGLDTVSHLLVLAWMDEADRNLVVQRPRHHGVPRGTFSVRSPARPNPIALSTVELLDITGASLKVRGLDCRDRTPLLDLKPHLASVDAWPQIERVG